MEVVEPGWRTHFSKFLKLSRSTLYSKYTKQSDKDALAIAQLKAVHEANPYYGVARFALELNWSEKKARRIRDLAGIKVMKRTKHRKGNKIKAEVSAPGNALKQYIDLRNKDRPQDGQTYRRMTNSRAWAQDFTYIWFRGMWVYIATVLDLKTTRIVGWSIGLRHNTELVHQAILDALSKHPPPTILHSDQGSEYLSYRLRDLCLKMEIILSCSDKSSPWQNGYKERFYGTFKDELGSVSRFKSIEELHEGVALTIYYYNHRRIHTALKMSPVAYATRLSLEE